MTTETTLTNDQIRERLIAIEEAVQIGQGHREWMSHYSYQEMFLPIHDKFLEIVPLIRAKLDAEDAAAPADPPPQDPPPAQG